jgi:hypothetical protein
MVCPGSSVPSIEFLDSLTVEKVSSLRFDVIGETVGQLALSVQQTVGRHGSGIQKTGGHGRNTGSDHIQALQSHHFSQIGKGLISPPVFKGQCSLFGNREIPVESGSRTGFQVGAVLPVVEHSLEFFNRR